MNLKKHTSSASPARQSGNGLFCWIFCLSLFAVALLFIKQMENGAPYTNTVYQITERCDEAGEIKMESVSFPGERSYKAFLPDSKRAEISSFAENDRDKLHVGLYCFFYKPTDPKFSGTSIPYLLTADKETAMLYAKGFPSEENFDPKKYNSWLNNPRVK